MPLCQSCLNGVKVALLTINGCFLVTFQKSIDGTIKKKKIIYSKVREKVFQITI